MKTLFIFLMLLFSLFSCKEKEKTTAAVMKTLNYPSASAVEYVDGKLYVMGDDATQMLVLDTNFNVIDSIQLFDYPEKRIPKDIKHDIESILYIKDSNQLMLFGSGSLSPYRDSVCLININTKQIKRKSNERFYNVLRNAKIKEMNIEGAVKPVYRVYSILVNRGHLGNPENNLIFSSSIFNADPVSMHTLPLRYRIDSSSFQGISGLTYSDSSNAIIMSVSTEATASTFTDGAIGKSYIWIMGNTYPAFEDEFKPNKVIDLEKIDTVFKGQKIESVTILNESKESLRLVLVADNDNGSSSIFKLSIKLN